MNKQIRVAMQNTKPLSWLLVVGIGVALAGAWSGMTQRAEGRPQATVPNTFDETKVAQLRDEAARIATAQANPNIPPSIDQPPTRIPGPTATPDFPDATPAGAGLLMPYAPELPGFAYIFTNMWRLQGQGESFTLVYAGSRQSNANQGMVVVQEGDASNPVRSVKEYPLTEGSGAGRITSVDGIIVSIATTNGEYYTFDVASTTLNRR